MALHHLILISFILTNNTRRGLLDFNQKETENFRVMQSHRLWVRVSRTDCIQAVPKLFVEIDIMGGSPDDVSENPVTGEKRKKGWRMSCDVGKAREGLENEL